MAHVAQREFCESVKQKFPEYFKNKDVIDFGSLDINGCNRPLFEDCNYIGVDIGPGPNVDVVCICHEYMGYEEFDVVCSTEMLEHDQFWSASLARMFHLLKPNGLIFLTWKGPGSGEHGTLNCDPGSSPLTLNIEGWDTYYKNISEEEVKDILVPDSGFKFYDFSTFEYYEGSKLLYRDIRFWGIKR